jgi:membrane-bound lytic murein transglycosylase B
VRLPIRGFLTLVILTCTLSPGSASQSPPSQQQAEPQQQPPAQQPPPVQPPPQQPAPQPTPTPQQQPPPATPNGTAAPAPEASPTTTAATTAAAFSLWLDGVREEALKRGIKPETVKQALDGVEPVAQILERDRSQAEFTLTTQQYFDRRLTRETLTTAKQDEKKYKPLLLRVQKAFGVQPRYLIAVWGLESNFGRFAGLRPMIPTLATLAFDARRGSYFREELFNTLQIVDRGDIALADLKGSWAGAMGQPQFMPSSYLAYAQDFDGDGRRDIWTSQPDVFASIAFYLKQRGWTDGQSWGRQVKVADSARDRIAEAAPPRTTGCRAERQLSARLPLKTWRKLGVRRHDGGLLPATDVDASLLQTDDGRKYLVYRNYEAILGYNCAHTYALSVSMLGDAMEGLGTLPVSKSVHHASKSKGKAHGKSKAHGRPAKHSKSTSAR